MNQAQLIQQQQQLGQHDKARRSRKPTDKFLPDNIDQCTVGDNASRYRELREFERRLDATTTRKRLDIVDSVNRSVKVSGMDCFTWPAAYLEY
jgi:SWI/SNF-related matrix-associated actin-dependent regulator of chromatin subfamily D